MVANTQTAEEWIDRKRWLWMLGPALPLIGITLGTAYIATGWSALLWSVPVLLFVAVPVIDLLLADDDTNPPDDALEALENDRYYRWLTYAFIPSEYFLLVNSMAAFGGWNPAYPWVRLSGLGDFFIAHGFGGLTSPTLEMSLAAKVALTFALGTLGGLGINVAHELGHKKEHLERWLARIALAQVFYGHFYVEHNRGHHVRVATPPDPASSRLGESFYAFWPRTVIGSLRSAWDLEKTRLRRRGTHPFHLDNDVLNAWLMSVVLFGGVIAAFGTTVIPWLLIQAVWGFTLLEIINYVEHYGMLRQKLESGRYERVAPRHSWNSNNLATNVLLYHLQRHSDHHANPTRRYQALRDFTDAPRLPTGYAGMIDLALVPGAFRRVMDHRVIEHLDGDLSLANVQPGKREAYERMITSGRFGGSSTSPLSGSGADQSVSTHSA